MSKHLLIAVSALLIGLCVTWAFAQPRSYVPKNGFIPNEKTAVRVGVAVLEAIYGEKQIASEQPFSAKLRKGEWTVTGTFPRGQRFGGVAEIKISKRSGCIISVTHGM